MCNHLFSRLFINLSSSERSRGVLGAQQNAHESKEQTSPEDRVSHHECRQLILVLSAVPPQLMFHLKNISFSERNVNIVAERFITIERFLDILHSK